MKRYLTIGAHRYEILGRMARVEHFADDAAALSFLKSVMDSEANVNAVREVYLDRFAESGVGAPDEAGMARLVAEALASGRLTMVSSPWLDGPVQPAAIGATVEERPPAKKAAPPPKEEPAEEAAEGEPDEETLVAAEEQAELFESSAQTGAPVCTA